MGLKICLYVPSMDTWLRILDSNQYRQSLAIEVRFELTISPHDVGKSFPLAYSMKVCCATFTPILNIKLGANYLCPEIGIEPIIFAFEANVLTF